MKAAVLETPIVIPLDDEHGRMMAYAQSSQGKTHIAKAEAEIAAGHGIIADDRYFSGLRERRQNGQQIKK